MDTADLADRIGVCARTVRDWRRERWQMDDTSLGRLCQLTNLQRPDMTLLPEHWSVAKASRIGGRRHFELYGNPATAAGRSLGGQRAQERFRSNPEFYRSLGVAVRKNVTRPVLSRYLAEFVGIVLGDGGMSSRQLTISFNSLDVGYARYVKQLGRDLFRIIPGKYADPHDQVFSLTYSGVALIEMLESLGLKRGDKVKHQVDVPDWIWREPSYQRACLRGLMDTDGCVYQHRYRVNNKAYVYTKLCFTNYSRPLLNSAKKIFEGLELFPTIHKDGHRLYLHNSRGVHRYFKLVGTNNPRYRNRYNVTH